MQLLIENSDVSIQVPKLFIKFVRKHFGLFETAFVSKYSDRVNFLTPILTTVAKEISLSSHSSFTDALLSFLTEDDEPSEKLSVEILPRTISESTSCKGYEEFNGSFFKKSQYCVVEAFLQRMNVYNSEALIELFQFVRTSLLSLNLNKKGLKLIIYLLEFMTELFVRKDTADQNYFEEGIKIIKSILCINEVVFLEKEELPFKKLFSGLKDAEEVSSLMRNYFLFKLNLKILHNVSSAITIDTLLHNFDAVSLAGSPYLMLMVSTFESHVKAQVSKLSVKPVQDTAYVISWRTTFKLLLHIHKYVLSILDRYDYSEEIRIKLEGVLSDISNNIKANRTKINGDIVCEYIETMNVVYLCRPDPTEDRVLAKYLELMTTVNSLDQEEHKGRKVLCRSETESSYL